MCTDDNTMRSRYRLSENSGFLICQYINVYIHHIKLEELVWINTLVDKMLNLVNNTLAVGSISYTKLLEESNDVLTELKNVVNITTLSMTDKERMDVVERCYSKMKRYRNLVSYYTNKNISVSYLRAKKKNDLDRIMGLYGNANERYW